MFNCLRGCLRASGRKLRTRRGVTLMEVLISLALMTILTVGISTGVSATGPVLKNSLTLSESQLLLDTLTKAISGELRYATDIEPIGPLNPEVTPPPVAGEDYTYPMDFTYSSKEYGPKARFFNVSKTGGGDPRLRLMVMNGGYDFVGNGIYSELGAKIGSIIYDDATRVFEVKLTIFFPNATYKEYTFSVRSILDS